MVFFRCKSSLPGPRVAVPHNPAATGVDEIAQRPEADLVDEADPAGSLPELGRQDTGTVVSTNAA
jgi:hypothetical protein